ncbi:hypothetical protein LQL77_30350, partial [Rhodococcus cerastii]|nr:hypothetical protein [Rhodococcus cerastii]
YLPASAPTLVVIRIFDSLLIIIREGTSSRDPQVLIIYPAGRVRSVMSTQQVAMRCLSVCETPG